MNTKSDGRRVAGGMQMSATGGANTRRPAHPMDTISGGPIGPSDPRGPFFSTQWEREDWERRQRGEPELGPGAAIVHCVHDWKEVESASEGAVVCTKCQVSGEDRGGGEVFWPAT